MKKTKKQCDASIRVLQTLKLLTESDMSTQEIKRYFEDHDKNNNLYSNEVIQKYINTLKVADFRFEKVHDKNHLINPLPRFSFNNSDLKGLMLIEKFLKIFPEETLKNEITQFIQNLEKRFDDDTIILAQRSKKINSINIKDNYTKYTEQIHKIEKYCNEKQRLKITYQKESNTETSLIADPIDIKYENDMVFIRVYNPLLGQIFDINISSILNIEQLPTVSNNQSILSAVSFKLKGRLAKVYRLKDKERLSIKNENGSIIIINQNEDRNHLLTRLSKYGENCEIISPKELRLAMKNKLNKTLALYSE